MKSSSQNGYLFLFAGLTLLAFGCCEPGLSRVDPNRVSLHKNQPLKTQDIQTAALSDVQEQNSIDDSYQQKFRVVRYSRPPIVELAAPISIVAADFDNDHFPDVVAGYGSGDQGILILQRGSGDYRNEIPFLESGNSFETPILPDLMVTGDFNIDGNEDLVIAARGPNRVCLLAGNGKGGFALARDLTLPGNITTLFAADTNRRDGRVNLFAGGSTVDGWQVAVFEGPDGAFSGQPEIFDLESEPIAYAAADYDQDHWIDLAVARKDGITLIYGRNRRLHSVDVSTPVRVQNVSLKFSIKSMANGRFTSDITPGLALLAENGKIHLLSPQKKLHRKKARIKWERRSLAKGLWPDASLILPAQITTQPLDDLLILDRLNSRIDLIAPQKQNGRYTLKRSFFASAEAVLPLRLNFDALSDLVILENEAGSNLLNLLSQPQAEYLVNLPSDEPDPNTADGVCDIDLVTSGDQCTLRAAIQQANANSGLDTIRFHSNVLLITPDSTLPVITDPVTILSWNQDFKTFISGINVPTISHGLQIQSGSSLIGNIGINGFGDCGIQLDTTGNNLISNVFSGTDQTGNAAVGNRHGICIINSPDNEISCLGCSNSNLISGNSITGIRIAGASSSNNLIRDSFVGTNLNGDQPLGNGGTGINLSSADFSTLTDSVISGNFGNGVQVDFNSDGSVIQGMIGIDATGNMPLSNGGAGVSILGSNNLVGSSDFSNTTTIGGNGFMGVAMQGNSNLIDNAFIGTNITGIDLGNGTDGILIQNADDNVIFRSVSAFNGVSGIRVLGDASERNVFSDNYIHSNSDIGIDLGVDGVTANDALDADAGPNGLQNYPVLTSAFRTGDITLVSGTLNSLPDTDFEIDLFWGPSCDPSGFGEGRNTFIEGSSNPETTDSNGNLAFQLNSDIPAGFFVSAIATRFESDLQAESSEFSACIQVVGVSAEPGCTLDPPPFTNLALGEEVSVQATVVNQNGSPASGVPISFRFSDFLADTPDWFEYTTTDNQGQAFTSGLISLSPIEVTVNASAETSEGILLCDTWLSWTMTCPEEALGRLTGIINLSAPSAGVEEWIGQHAALQKYKQQFSKFSTELITLLTKDRDLNSRTNHVISVINEKISGSSQNKTIMINSESWQLINDLIAVYLSKASPEFSKQLKELHRDLSDPEFQNEIGLLVAQRPVQEEEK